MLRKYYRWMIFLAVFLLLAFSATSYAKAIDSILWPVRFGILAGFSLLFVWSWWRHRDDSSAHRKLPRATLPTTFSPLFAAGTTATRKSRNLSPLPLRLFSF